MVDDYTPTTEEVRGSFVRIHHAGGLYTVEEVELRRGECFDRWLAQHDAEVAAVARSRVMALTVDVDTESGEVTVNGETFPYYLANEPTIVAEVGPSQMGVVTLPIVVNVGGSIFFHRGAV